MHGKYINISFMHVERFSTDCHKQIKNGGTNNVIHDLIVVTGYSTAHLYHVVIVNSNYCS